VVGPRPESRGGSRAQKSGSAQPLGCGDGLATTAIRRIEVVYMSEYKRVKIFCPPITADRTQTPGGDPAELVRVYKALGDERRLKLLRRLQDGPLSLGDAAKEVGLAKSTTHHHLAILRQAGFVLIREGDDTYTLRPDMRPEPGALLESYLGT
jgi:DNA-binding transcriptional ArsR family regulator